MSTPDTSYTFVKRCSQKLFRLHEIFATVADKPSYNYTSWPKQKVAYLTDVMRANYVDVILAHVKYASQTVKQNTVSLLLC